MSFLPGMFPAIAAATGRQPASFVFNGTDEALTRTLTTAGVTTTTFTISAWMKVTAYASGFAPLIQTINAPTNSAWTFAGLAGTGDAFGCEQEGGASDWSESADTLTPDIPTATWTHLLVQYDSTQGTADNRIRFYINGVGPLTDIAGAAGAPGASEIHNLLTNGRQMQLGAYLDVPRRLNGKLAFINVVNASVTPAAFGFLNGAVWTRIPYTGVFGANDISLDGTDGFNDVSGNNHNFTGVNMDATNLDFSDLPPFTM